VPDLSEIIDDDNALSALTTVPSVPTTTATALLANPLVPEAQVVSPSPVEVLDPMSFINKTPVRDDHDYAID